MRSFEEIKAKLDKTTPLEHHLLPLPDKQINVEHYNEMHAKDQNSRLVAKEDYSGVVTLYPNAKLEVNQFLIERKIRYKEIFEHRHEYIEMVYVLEGEFRQVIEGQIIEMRKGDFCILDKNVVHGSKSLSDNDFVVNFTFSPDFFEGIFLTLFSDSNVVSNFILNSLYSMNREQDYILLHIEEDSLLQRLLTSLIKEYFNKEIRTWSAVKGYLLIIFTELSRLFSDSDHTNIQMKVIKEEELLKKEMLTYMETHSKEVTLTEMADYFNFYPSYLSSFIKNTFGKTLKEITIDIKLAKACHLLKNSNLAIDDIIYEVGYANKSYFYKRFKKQYGMTPHHYRVNSQEKIKKDTF